MESQEDEQEDVTKESNKKRKREEKRSQRNEKLKQSIMTPVNELFNKLKESINELKNELKESLKTFERKVEKKLDNVEKKLEKKLDNVGKKVDVLLETNPLACLKLAMPSLLTSDEGIQRAVHHGGTATWTIVKTTVAGQQTRYFAIGSKHCAFFYGYVQTGNVPGPHFVSLPQRIVDAGVIGVGILGYGRSILKEHDAVAIELNNCPDGLDAKKITIYEVPETMGKSKGFVVGMSESGPILGKSLVQANNHGHYIFVEDQGEPGNSGTLMFTADPKNPGKLQIFGTYYGLDDDKGAGLRSRGVVSPLPASINTFDFKKQRGIADMVTLTVFDKRGCRNVTAVPFSAGGFLYHKLQDGGEDWPGVILEKGFFYQGWLMIGSARSK